ncbi:hypothetical protein Pcinc_007753 [Petrolisthes cinctipes]|uniref:Uncharacterized protein n=1 Tax=Petrolisthes cinctipes TaxID=88211 RepID=A0AAE1GEN1_PETCI|nr:hypothetical protein Pcinc_007753 [Petrolisthes cinctipes]
MGMDECGGVVSVEGGGAFCGRGGGGGVGGRGRRWWALWVKEGQGQRCTGRPLHLLRGLRGSRGTGEVQREAGEALAGNRTAFLEAIVDISATSPNTYKERVSMALEEYEGVVEEAVGVGVTTSDPHTPSYDWTYLKSVFSHSLLSPPSVRIREPGPSNVMGSHFCILYGLVGIPLTLSVIAALVHSLQTSSRHSIQGFRD